MFGKLCLAVSILVTLLSPSREAIFPQYEFTISWDQSSIPSDLENSKILKESIMTGLCISVLEIENSPEVMALAGIEIECSMSLDGVQFQNLKNCKLPLELGFSPKTSGVHLLRVKISRKKGRWRWTRLDEFQSLMKLNFSVHWISYQTRSHLGHQLNSSTKSNCPESTHVYFEFEETNNLRTLELQLDNANWHPVKSTMQFQVTPGHHQLQFRPTPNSKSLIGRQSLIVDSSDRQDPSGVYHRHVLSDAMEDEDDVEDWMNGNLLIALLVGLVIVLILFFVFLAVYWYRTQSQRRQNLSIRSRQGGGSQIVGPESGLLSHNVNTSDYSSFLSNSWPRNLRRFRFDELWAATGGFSETRVLGEGGFGKVYGGKLLDGRSVAIKKLESNGQQGDREFFAEVATLNHAKRHPNILNLLGICIDQGVRICVFELMDSGSVRYLLDNKNSTFTWKARLKVALGVARGLACLHESIDPPIVHRDLKSENILLDKKGEARISDFGLCTLAHHEARNPGLSRNVALTVGTIRGTFGYLAPEVINSGKVSTKSDVYAFGIVLLELLTARRPIETGRPSEEQDLVKWVLRSLDDMHSLMETVDSSITDKVSVVQITGFVELAASCLSLSASHRPSALQVSMRLEELLRFKDKTGAVTRKIDICVKSKLSETSGTIPTCLPGNASPSEGDQSSLQTTTPRTGRSSCLDLEMELPPVQCSTSSVTKQDDKERELPLEEAGPSEEQSSPHPPAS